MVSPGHQSLQPTAWILITAYIPTGQHKAVSSQVCDIDPLKSSLLPTPAFVSYYFRLCRFCFSASGWFSLLLTVSYISRVICSFKDILSSTISADLWNNSINQTGHIAMRKMENKVPGQASDQSWNWQPQRASGSKALLPSSYRCHQLSHLSLRPGVS